MIGVFHNSHDIRYRQPFGAVRCGQRVVLRLKVLYSKEPRVVYIRIWELEMYERKIYMNLAKADGETYIFEGEFIAPDTPGLLWYYFVIEYEHISYYYGNNANRSGGVGFLANYPPDSYQITVYNREFTTPNWFKDSIIYHIFVDRFYNGNEGGIIIDVKMGI